MNRLRFGTAGAPQNPPGLSTADGIKRIAELGLDCLEIEFVQGVRMSQETARQVSAIASNRDIRLSVHAPYYINLNAREPEKVIASQSRLIQAARAASICGAVDVVFHAAFYMGDPPETAYEQVKKHLAEVMGQLAEEKIAVKIRPEIMGKTSQFGTLEEVLSLSSEIEGLAPCVDFAHWHARTGKNNSYLEFSGVLSKIKKRLGKKALEDMHIHVAGIAYGKNGEMKHLNLQESDFQYLELLRALNDHNVGGILICESPNLEDDARLLQTTYTNLHNKHRQI
jgi:deoxyribonuclease-4